MSSAMTILGNLFLGVTALIFVFLLSLIFGPKPPQAGDAAMGYPFTVLLLHGLMLAGLAVVAFAVGWNGGFNWISPDKGLRLVLVMAAVPGILLVSTLAAWFKYENGPAPFPFSLKIFCGLVPALFPGVLILAGAVLLNESLRSVIPFAVVRLPLAGVAGLAALGLLGGISSWISLSAQKAVQVAENRRLDEEQWVRNHLEQIENCDPASFEVAQILGFTTEYQNPAVREKALEKVKSNPQWQQHLIYLIDNNASVEVFSFLAYNDVEDKSLFPDAVNRATLRMADYVRRTINEASHSAHFYEDQFSFEVEQVLLTVEKFQGMGTDFRPAVRAMRAALDEPSVHKKIRFRAEKTLDTWLKKNS